MNPRYGGGVNPKYGGRCPFRGKTKITRNYKKYDLGDDVPCRYSLMDMIGDRFDT